MCFFFQAEDGIRDLTVTGVQTCALPILLEHQPNGRLMAMDPKTLKPRTLLRGIYFANGVAVSPDQSFVLVAETGRYRIRRSEERRIGKECRSRWSDEH